MTPDPSTASVHEAQDSEYVPPWAIVMEAGPTRVTTGEA